MLPKSFRKLLPTPDSIRQHKVLGRLGAWLHHPSLWHLNRRSVAGGVGIGMFCGLIPGPLQMLGAALLAIPLRVNLPVALLTTLYTNPLTIVPLYFLAYKIGAFVLGAAGRTEVDPPPAWAWTHPIASVEAFGQWMIGLGAPLAVGVVLLATLLATCGYVTVRVLWNLHLRHAWLARRNRRTRGRA